MVKQIAVIHSDPHRDAFCASLNTATASPTTTNITLFPKSVMGTCHAKWRHSVAALGGSCTEAEEKSVGWGVAALVVEVWISKARRRISRCCGCKRRRFSAIDCWLAIPRAHSECSSAHSIATRAVYGGTANHCHDSRLLTREATRALYKSTKARTKSISIGSPSSLQNRVKQYTFKCIEDIRVFTYCYNDCA